MERDQSDNPQNISRNRNTVFALADRFQRQARCLAGGKNLEFIADTFSGENGFYVFDHLCIMGTCVIEPENCL